MELGPVKTLELPRSKGIGKKLLNTYMPLQPSLCFFSRDYLSHSYEQWSYGMPTVSSPSLCLVRTNSRTSHVCIAKSLDQVLSLTQLWRFRRPSQRPASAISDDIHLSFNTLKLLKAAASPQGPLQAPAQGQTKPTLPESQEEILIEVTREEYPSGSPSGASSPRLPAPGIAVPTWPLWKVGFLVPTQGAAPCSKPPWNRTPTVSISVSDKYTEIAE